MNKVQVISAQNGIDYSVNFDKSDIYRKLKNKQKVAEMTGALILTITPDLAERWLSWNQTNRPASKRIISEYARRMSEGLWEMNGETIILNDIGGINDGQHRLMACVKSGADFEALVFFGARKESFHTLGDTYKRTPGHVLSIEGAKNYNNTAAAIRQIMFLEGGVVNGGFYISNSEVLDWYRSNIEINDILSVSDHWNDISGGILTKSEYMAYLWVFAKSEAKKAYEFFNNLAFGTVTGKNDPVYHLRAKLMRCKMDSNYSMTKKYRQAIIIKAWNAFKKGKEMKLLSFSPEREKLPKIK